MKLLTVAIPCYNSQDYMEHAVETALVGGEDIEILIIDDGSKYVRNFIDTAVSKGLIYIEDDKYILNPYLHIMSFGTDKSVYKLFDNLPEWNHLIERMEKYYDEYNLELTFYKRESKYDRNQIVYEYVEYY